MKQQEIQRIDERKLVQSGYRYAMSLTHNLHDAEDLIQQACLQVFRKRGKLIEKSYLFVSIRNLFFDQCRSAGRKQKSSIYDDSLVDPAVSHVREVDGRVDVQQLLATLRSEEREVLYLNSIEGFTAQEISELTDQPRNSVLSLMSRAKKKLSENSMLGRTKEESS